MNLPSFFSCYGDHQDLHSFPTRRSSDLTTKDFDQVTHLSVGSSIEVKGILVLTPERSQPFELKALEVNLIGDRSEEHTSELQSRPHLVCRLLLEKKKKTTTTSVR